MGLLASIRKKLTRIECYTLTDLANKTQALIDNNPCIYDFLAIANNPDSTQEDIDAAIIVRDECLANLRNERLSASVLTDPSADETGEEFDKYVAKYGDATMHNYDGATTLKTKISSSPDQIMSSNSARDAQFQEWSIGCGSAPEFLWLRYDICPCDSKELFYVDNGTVKEDDYFFILPDGKNPESVTNVLGKSENLNIVVNGKLVPKKFVVSSQKYPIESNSIADGTIAANLKQKVFNISGSNGTVNSKQAFLYV